MKKIILLVFFITSSIGGYTQSSYTITSKDGKVTVENFIGFGGGRDSVIVKHKKHKIKFSRFNPLFDFTDEHGYNPVDYSFLTYSVKKITKKIYMIVGVGGNLSLETELNLIFIKKDKILKYYVVNSNDKLLRDVTFEYLPKTKEVLIPILKIDTPKDYIYEIDLKENRLDSIKALPKSANDRYYHRYRLKIK